MEAIGSFINMKQVRELAKRNGANVDDPNLTDNVKDYRQGIYQTWVKSAKQNKNDYYNSLSLYDGGQKVSFEFSRWKPELQANVQKAKDVGNQAFMLAKQMLEKPMKVVMVGGPGVGKTSLALAMLSTLKEHGKSTLFVSSAEFTTMYGERYDYPDIKKRLESVSKAMKEVDVLVIDDFGTEGGVRSERAVRRDVMSELEHVANARFDIQNNRTLKSTIVTTNNNIQELQNIYSPKMISRLMPHKAANQIIFDGLEDMRE